MVYMKRCDIKQSLTHLVARVYHRLPPMPIPSSAAFAGKLMVPSPAAPTEEPDAQ